MLKTTDDIYSTGGMQEATHEVNYSTGGKLETTQISIVSQLEGC